MSIHILVVLRCQQEEVISRGLHLILCVLYMLVLLPAVSTDIKQPYPYLFLLYK